ncbi:MAG TPA: nitrogen fixation protein NifM, partial [Rhodocyclaceae bacterium]|nr:nitrogen fixation protein NifM [Rhodocyclaceae bacterium]
MSETAYLTLKLARELFQVSPESLAPEQRQRVDEVAGRQREIERRILGSREAAGVVLPAEAADRALRDIRARYPSDDEYAADLAKAGLSEAQLRAAVERDQKVEAVLEQVAGRAVPVSDTDVEIFYLVHRERFRRPETRSLRHILLTVNDAVAGSERASARRRLEEIRARLLKSPDGFADEALKASECPTAVNGGLLGTVKRGQLFPELEPAAFALGPGQLSAIVESPMGFHVLHCVAAEEACDLPLSAVRQKIRGHLQEGRRRAAQKAWIGGLF